MLNFLHFRRMKLHIFLVYLWDILYSREFWNLFINAFFGLLGSFILRKWANQPDKRWSTPSPLSHLNRSGLQPLTHQEMTIACCFYCFRQRWAYFDMTNFLEVSTYVATLLTLLPANGNIENNRQWACGIIALLLAFVAMLLQAQL